MKTQSQTDIPDLTVTGRVPPANFRQLGQVCGFTDLANAYEQVTAQRDELLAACKAAIALWDKQTRIVAGEEAIRSAITKTEQH